MGGSQSIEVGGFRIFKVNPGSPAAEAGLEVFFDFILEIDGVHMDADQATFATAIQEAENHRTKLVVHNIRTHTVRDVYVTPRRWGGAGLLGAVVRYDTLESAEGQGMRVLTVFPNSPAEAAGLVPNKDFLLGTTEVMFRDMDELTEVVNLYMGMELKIYVYNTEVESIREVIIVPSTQWGGDGAIGADIRTGLLHRIPAPRRAFNIQPQAPAEMKLQPGGKAEQSLATGNQEAPAERPVNHVDLQQVQPLLAQVQDQLQQLQELQMSQGHLTDVQQEHFRQLVHMQQLLQSHIAQQAQKDGTLLASAAVEVGNEDRGNVPISEDGQEAHAVPNGDVPGHQVMAQRRPVFELPAAAKAAWEAARSPLDTLAPGVIYETAVS
ncbi:GORASP2 [Symbiodinium pilosum]|uniref:GORASP2 protein n=1 Tax=Symbiodinium pilosum TaxID=2952 RepID=A0A812QLN9_SYMPI|nr:GORASP2 [Symbiodinium pilosum]